MGLIILAGPPLGSAVVEKSELIMSELILPFFFIHVGVRNASLLSFILNFKGVIEHSVFLWWRLQKLVDDSYFTAFVLSTVIVNAIMSPLIQIFYKIKLGSLSFLRKRSKKTTINVTHRRVTSHLGVRITMMRIDFKADDDNNKSERYQDESLINEFKSKAIGNASVLEILADTPSKGLLLIRSVQTGLWNPETKMQSRFPCRLMVNDSPSCMTALAVFSSVLSWVTANVWVSSKSSFPHPRGYFNNSGTEFFLGTFALVRTKAMNLALKLAGHEPGSKALKVNVPLAFLGLLLPHEFCLGTFALWSHQGHKPSSKSLKGIAEGCLPFDCNKAMNPAPKLAGRGRRRRGKRNGDGVQNGQRRQGPGNVRRTREGDAEVRVTAKERSSGNGDRRQVRVTAKEREGDTGGGDGNGTARRDGRKRHGERMKVRILQTAKKSWNVGLTCFVVPWAISLFVFYQLQTYIPEIATGNFLVYLCALSSRSFLPVIAHALGELNLLTSDLGQLAISSATIHEILGWCITCLAVFPQRGGEQRNTPEGKPVDETYVRGILLAPLITGVVSDILGSTYFPGALIMGLIIPAGPPLVTDWKAFGAFQFTLAAGYVGKVAGSLLSLLCFKTGIRTALLLSFILNIKGVLEFTISSRWRINKRGSGVALRMSSKLGVSIMLYRILLTEDYGKNYRENHLDECLVNKFIAKNIGNPRVVFKEFKTNESLQVCNTIHSVENNYELVHVGHRRAPLFAHHTVIEIFEIMSNNTSDLSTFNFDGRRGMLMFISRMSSRLIYFILRPLKQPKFVCDVLSGILLGPSVMGRNKGIMDLIFHPENMMLDNTMSALGAIYFIFITSVKMDKSRILLTAKKAWNVGVTCYAVPLAISLFVFYQLQTYIPGISGGNFPVYLCALSSRSFLPVIAHALVELNLLTSDLGQLAISSVTVHEILGWCISFVAFFVQDGEGEHWKGILTVLSFLALTIFSIFILRPLMLWIIRNTPEGKPVDGTYVRGILLAPVITGGLSDILGLTYYTGPMVIGLIIPAGPPLGSAIVDKCELVLSEIFLPFLYIRLGQLTNVHSVTDWKAFVAFQFTLAAGYVGKVAGSFLSLLCFKTGIRTALLLGFILNIKGVLEFSLSSRWRINKYIDDASYTTFVISNVLVTAIVTPLIQIFYKPETRLVMSRLTEIHTRTLQATPLDSELRVLCCIHCEDNVPGIITLLKALSSTLNGPICNYAVHVTELIGMATPVLDTYESKSRKLLPNSTDRIMRALSDCSKASSFSVVIQPFRMIAPYKLMHEMVCKLAHDKYIPLIILPFPEGWEVHGKTNSLCSFITNVEDNSPSTVGIFVDRSPPRYSNSAKWSFKVALFFLGGPDDREALALALRMSGNPRVSITLYRILLKEDSEEDYRENHLDECLVNKFFAKNISNPGVVIKKFKANKSLQVFDTVRSMENKYDLVLVGKRREAHSNLEQEMNPWVEYKELGVIGDMLASSDFGGGLMSILVIQSTAVVNNVSSKSFSVDRNGFSFSSSQHDRDRNNVQGHDQVSEN
ncbi:hypothetical protein ACOSQ2_032640 [Xanthoceras sorbifolium]